MHPKIKIAGSICALMALGACANLPHNNVLLFGTDTKVALDVSSAATQGGAPQITLGYRRAEAVWMPLVANVFSCPDGPNGGCAVETALAEATDGPFKGKVVPVVLTGTDIAEGQGQDAFSVFASFGAKFSGEAAPSAAQASGGLAQFFATGIAAQRIAESEQLEGILKVANRDEAAARAAVADSEAVQTLSAEQKANILQAANTNKAEQVLVANCLSTDAGKTKFLSGVPSDFKSNRKFTSDRITGLGDDAEILSWWRLLNKNERRAAITAYSTECTT